MAKQKMNTIFEKNSVTPNDKDFIYDKRVEFDSTGEACEWDDEDSDQDF